MKNSSKKERKEKLYKFQTNSFTLYETDIRSVSSKSYLIPHSIDSSKR